MEIRFWGVRGSIASAGANVSRIGGNTSCVEVSSGEHCLILDAGTGIRALGETLLRRGTPVNATVLFSHLHWDHVQGFPFFGPAYAPSSRLTLLGPGPDGEKSLRAVLERQMSPPSFPVTLEAMRAKLSFGSALAGHPFDVGTFHVVPFLLPHPGGSLGYRIEADGHVFVYATDVELTREALTEELLQAMNGADVLCLDAQYTPEEYQASKKGWGHSTMVDAAQIASACHARRLVLFHHDPSHGDDQVEEMAETARAHFLHAEPAREGKRIVLGRTLPFVVS